MILQALNRYYDILADDPESGIAPYGFSTANVSFAINLSPDGELLEIFPQYEKVQRGINTLEVPRRMNVPEQVKRSSGIRANFLCDNSAYVLGVSDKGNEAYALDRFTAFKELNKQILSEIESKPAGAVVAFLNRWDPAQVRGHPAIVACLEQLIKPGNLVFIVEGTSGFAHEDQAIRQAWEKYRVGASGDIYQCLVSGEKAPVARLHANLKGVTGSNSSGATLVGFNAPAYESYNRTDGQGLNSPVSEKAAFAYTTALNYLLSRENPNRKFQLGDTTVVYWAESADPAYGMIFAELFGVNWNDTSPQDNVETVGRDRKAEERLKEIAEKVKRGQALDLPRLMEGLNPDIQFYVLGLAPNVSRISVRFFFTDPFRKVVLKIMAHYQDMQIDSEWGQEIPPITIRQMINETVSKKASDPKAAPLMTGAVFRSVLENLPYPAALYNAILNRVRVDMDDKERRISKINHIRAAITKAYLIRKYRNLDNPKVQEVLCMSLNEQSTNQAYLLGRLFAVLEIAQREAAKPTKLDATIKDRYFTAACASPATVFPVLLRLSQHHISKAEYGYATDKRIEKIMNLLDIENDPIPAHLSLDEQGIFILGYYHQRAGYYPPKANPEISEDVETEQ